VREERPRVRVSHAARERLVESFMRAVELRDRDALLALFAEEATLTADGGGKAKAAQKIVRGGASVVRFMLGVLSGARERLTFQKIVVNGETGLAVRMDGQLVSVMSFATDGRRIFGLYSVLNPDKLHGVALAQRH
jgi:RNA polymerase sigma-70 factor, ECF subfamily